METGVTLDFAAAKTVIETLGILPVITFGALMFIASTLYKRFRKQQAIAVIDEVINVLSKLGILQPLQYLSIIMVAIFLYRYFTERS